MEEKIDILNALNALQGVKFAQQEIRAGRLELAAMLTKYYERLPEKVKDRLSLLTRETVARAQPPPEEEPNPENIRALAKDDAFEQVVRATNYYRDRLGYAPLDATGWPEKGGTEAICQEK